MGTTGPLPGTESPDIVELRGREEVGLAVPVRIDEPVTVRTLPTRQMTARNFQVEPGEPVMIAKLDLTRSRIQIRTRDGAVWLGAARADVLPTPTGGIGNAAAFCPSTVTPLDLGTCDEIWVRAATVTTLVSTISEHWVN